MQMHKEFKEYCLTVSIKSVITRVLCSVFNDAVFFELRLESLNFMDLQSAHTRIRQDKLSWLKPGLKLAFEVLSASDSDPKEPNSLADNTIRLRRPNF